MLECMTCKKKISFVRRFAIGAICRDCENKEREVKQKESEEREKEDKAIKLLEDRGIRYFPDSDELHVVYLGTELGELLPERTTRGLMGFVSMANTSRRVSDGKGINTFKSLVKSLIESNYDIDGVVNYIYETIIRSLEVENIKKRQRKLNLKEEAEKIYFGEIKNKRKSLTEEEKVSILDKFNRQCTICGATEGLHIHHKDKNPKNNTVANLIVLCGVCHKKIHMKVR